MAATEGGHVDKDLTLKIHVMEDDTDTLAHAVLDLRGDHFESVGKARRNPVDKPMPVIGEELALARALQDLAAQVTEAAHAKIEEFLTR